MHLRNVDLIITVIIALTNIIWALLPHHPPVIGIVLALPLVFLLPGYVLTDVLSHKHTLKGIHRFTMILGLSLSTDILGGFTLNIFPLGLRAWPWAILLGLLTTVFSLLAAHLRRGSSRGEIRLPKFHFRVHEYVLLGLAIGVATFALEYSATQAVQQPHTDLTQFWMLPSSQANNNCAIRLGVHSFETMTRAYRITLAVNGIRANTWPALVLAPQEKWERLVPISPGPTSSIYVEAWLYKSDKPETVYHQVHMTLQRLGGSKDQKMQC